VNNNGSLRSRVTLLLRQLGPKLHRHMRLAGKSRGEFFSEFLARVYLDLGVEPAEALVAVAMRAEVDIPEVDELSRTIRELLRAVGMLEKRYPGLPSRLLAAVKAGKPITEETIYPDGRPDSEQTSRSRQGEKIHWELTQVSNLSNY
jgi:hypothetical protein